MRLFTGVMMALLAVSPALAIDFNQPIRDGKGDEVKAGDKTATLGSICETALTSSYRDEVDAQTGKETITGEEKYRRWKLASRLHGNVNLSPEDLALVKKFVGKAFTPQIVGPAWDMLDPSLGSDK